jgi:hypothetical protein
MSLPLPWAGAVCVIAIALAPRTATAEDEPPRGSLFYPDGPGEHRLRVGAGALLDVLPRQTVENELRSIPKLTANVRYGLPWGFSADARLAAIYLENELEVGAAWSLRLGPVSTMVFDHSGVWYGIVDVDGFDASAWGFMNQPGVGVGLPWQDIRFTFTAEAIVMLQKHVQLGDSTQSSRKQVEWAGLALRLVVENLLDDGGDIYYGVGAMYAQPDYQAWLAFSDSRAHLWYPRFVAGYAF